MPLPKPPSKKAAHLSAADFESQAAPKPEKRTIKPHAEVPPAELALHDGGAPIAARPILPLPAPAAAAVAAPRPRLRPSRAGGRPSCSCSTPTC